MNGNVYQKINHEYEKRRRKALQEMEDRKSELYYHLPRLEEVDSEISQAGFKYNKAILMGLLPSDSAVEKLTQTIDTLKSEKKKLLNKSGFSPEYLSLTYQCEKCSDTGFIRSPHGGADVMCICFKQQLINHLHDQSKLCVVNNEGFVSFDLAYYPEFPNEERYGINKAPRRQIQGILDNCVRFVDHFQDSNEKNLLFSGPTGVGKTFMAGCIAMELMNRGYTVLYQTAPALFNTIYEYRYNTANNDDWEPAIYNNILQSDLLIIDDLGTESPSGMRYAELLNIIDTRLANDTRKPCKTIISTNIDLKKLFDYYDERIVSRITGGFDIFRFAGDDIRRLKKA